MIYYKHNRSIDRKKVDEIRIKLNRTFKLGINNGDILNVEKKILNIEDKCKGRFAGHIEDYILLYYAAYSHYRKERNKRLAVIEIGTLFGCSTILIWHAIKDAKADAVIYAIDPLEGYYGVTESDDGLVKPKDIVTGFEIDESTVRDNLSRFGISGDECELITDVSQSSEVIERMRGVKSTFLFVDGDHSRSGLFLDLSNYVKLLTTSSMIVVDNFVDPDWLGVTEEIFHGRYFEAGITPIAFEKRLLVCENSKRIRETSVYGDICEGLLELIGNKERSRLALTNKIAHEEKRYNSLMESRHLEFRKIAEDSLKSVGELQKQINALKQAVSQSVRDESGKSLERFEGLTSSLSKLEKSLTDLGEGFICAVKDVHGKELKLLGDLKSSLEQTLQRESGKSVQRLDDLEESLSFLDKSLKTLGDDLNLSAKDLHGREIMAVDGLKLSLEKSLQDESVKSIDRLDGLAKGLAQLGDHLARSEKEIHNLEMQTLEELQSSLENFLREQSGLSEKRFDGVGETLSLLEKGIIGLKDELGESAAAMHGEVLKTLGEFRLSLEKSLTEESRKSEMYSKRSGKTLSTIRKNLTDFKRSSVRAAKDRHGKALKVLGELRVSLEGSIIAGSEKTEGGFERLGESVSDFEKKFLDLGTTLSRNLYDFHSRELVLISEVKDSLEKTDLAEKRFAILNDQFIEAKQQCSDLQKRLDRLSSDYHSKELECARNAAKASEFQALLEMANGEIQENRSMLSELRTRFDAVSDRSDELGEHLRHTQVSLASTEGVLENLRSEHDSARQLIARYESDLQEAKRIQISSVHKEQELKNELIRLAGKSIITKRDKEAIRKVL